MARSRADEILEGWKMVAHNAAKPLDAPRPDTYRSALPIGVLGTAAVVLVLIAGLSLRGGLGPQASPNAGGNTTASASPSATGLPSQTATPSQAPSEVATPSQVPSQPASSSQAPSQPASAPATVAAQTPSPADVAAAGQVVDRYTADLVRGDYASAWSLLGPEARTHWGSLANFTYDRSAYFKSVAGRYSVKTQPGDVAPITDWLAGTYGASIDLRHAVLVEVDYPTIAQYNALDLYIVNPGSGGLAIYDVR